MTFRILGALALGTMLCGPAMIIARADDEHHEAEKARKYYDKEQKDYHEWTKHEDRAYRQWVKEHHYEYRDFNRVDAERQREYWEWRHKHPDSMLWPNER